ncbi:MAG: PAS domain S-box protein, partial [Candidatus Tantalella remota]|nr:PAS domain S-box protein [Candidatus Tantalella remota]
DDNIIKQGQMVQVKDVFCKKKPIHFELQWNAVEVRNVDFEEGYDVYIEASMFPVVDKSGELMNVICQWVDISKRMEAEEKSKNLAKFPAENSSPVLRIAKDGKVLYANVAAEEVLKNWKTSLNKNVPERWQRIIEETLKTGKSMLREETMGEHFLSFVVAPVMDAGYVNLYARDVTERNKAVNALRKSEENFRLIINTSPVGICTVDSLGNFVTTNPAYEQMLGYSKGELIGLSFFDVTHTDDRPKNKKLFQDMFSSNSQKFSMEKRYIRKDGVQINVTVHATGIIGDDEKNMFGTAFVEDITERKKAEEELHASEEKYSSLIDHIPDVAWTTDQGGHTSFISPNVNEMYGYEPEEIYERGEKIWFGRIHPDDIEATKKAFRELFDKGKSLDIEYRIKTKEGKWIWLHDRSVGLYEKNGKKYAAGIFSDITEKKKTEDELKKYRLHLEELVEERTKELEAFSYSVSHDLRAPLRSMDGFSRILLDTCSDKLDDESKDNLMRVRKASQRMAQLIDDILTLFQVTRKEFKKEHVDLSRIGELVAADLKRNDPSCQVDIVIQPGLFAEGDLHLLQLVLENLLSNAWKFTSKSEKAKIEFGKVPGEEENVFFVRDNGAGFDMKYADKLFGAFQRLHSDKEFPGTGIGLVSVKRIISRHGGRVWAKGEVGKGATFHFTL